MSVVSQSLHVLCRPISKPGSASKGRQNMLAIGQRAVELYGLEVVVGNEDARHLNNPGVTIVAERGDVVYVKPHMYEQLLQTERVFTLKSDDFNFGEVLTVPLTYIVAVWHVN